MKRYNRVLGYRLRSRKQPQQICLMIKALVKVVQSDVNVGGDPLPSTPDLPNHQSSRSRGNNLIYFYCMEGRVWEEI